MGDHARTVSYTVSHLPSTIFLAGGPGFSPLPSMLRAGLVSGLPRPQACSQRPARQWRCLWALRTGAVCGTIVHGLTHELTPCSGDNCGPGSRSSAYAPRSMWPRRWCGVPPEMPLPSDPMPAWRRVTHIDRDAFYALVERPSATAIAKGVRATIREETGLIASAGVSCNKLLAKPARTTASQTSGSSSRRRRRPEKGQGEVRGRHHPGARREACLRRRWRPACSATASDDRFRPSELAWAGPLSGTRG